MMNPRKGEEPALADLVAGLRSGGPDFADDPAKARADFEATTAMVPVAEDIAFEEIDLGGVRVLKGGYPGADHEAALLYLHGGAFIAGSAHGYRGLAANIARRADSHRGRSNIGWRPNIRSRLRWTIAWPPIRG